MATFMILPARESVEHYLAQAYQRILPGLSFSGELLTETLSQVVVEENEVYLIHREDLPGLDQIERDLIDVFGASVGDSVIEVPAIATESEAKAREWKISVPVSETSKPR